MEFEEITVTLIFIKGGERRTGSIPVGGRIVSQGFIQDLICQSACR